MFHPIDDLRIKWTKVVLPPVFLEEEMPTTETASATVHGARHEICEILGGRDRRLLVVCGPCSIHDTQAARELNNMQRLVQRGALAQGTALATGYGSAEAGSGGAGGRTCDRGSCVTLSPGILTRVSCYDERGLNTRPGGRFL